MTTRTDPHRPGAIIPAHYEHVLSFNLATTQDGWPVPSYGINCELDGHHEVDGKTVNWSHSPDGGCCVIGCKQKRARHGGPGRCDICGASYIYGDLWLHTPTQEVIFLGHDCARKYAMLADRSEWEIAHGRLRRAAATQLLKAQKLEARAAFLTKHPGLEEALAMDHEILRDLKSKLIEYTDLSDKQVALAFRLASETKNPRPEDKHVPAPTGKQIFRGTVISVKGYESDFGTVTRMTVKVTTPDGTWLAWGTAPAALMGHDHGPLKGCEVEVTATLSPGNDPHFAIMKRPRGKLIKTLCDSETCRGCLRESMGDEAYELMLKVRELRHLEMRCRATGVFETAARVQSEADALEWQGRPAPVMPKPRKPARSSKTVSSGAQ